ncbi:hypothetical protein FWC63_02270 [Candidatus Saccharibacteria bacterium]|nr:hypothetical protein [Candidatus Saccharibacteria bacterium]
MPKKWLPFGGKDAATPDADNFGGFPDYDDTPTSSNNQDAYEAGVGCETVTAAYNTARDICSLMKDNPPGPDDDGLGELSLITVCADDLNLKLDESADDCQLANNNVAVCLTAKQQADDTLAQASQRLVTARDNEFTGKSNLDAAKQERDGKKSLLTPATDAFNQADGAKNLADAALQGKQDADRQAQEALNIANAKVSAQETARATIQNLADKTEDGPVKDAFNAELQKIADELNAATGEQSTAKSNAQATSQELTQAEKAAKTAQTNWDTARSALDTVLSDIESALKAFQDAETSYHDAEIELKAAIEGEQSAQNNVNTTTFAWECAVKNLNLANIKQDAYKELFACANSLNSICSALDQQATDFCNSLSSVDAYVRKCEDDRDTAIERCKKAEAIAAQRDETVQHNLEQIERHSQYLVNPSGLPAGRPVTVQIPGRNGGRQQTPPLLPGRRSGRQN